MPGGVYRVGLPRSDLKVTLVGVEVKPALALGSWLAFEKIGGQAMVMGDLQIDLDTAAIDEVLGAKGVINGGVRC